MVCLPFEKLFRLKHCLRHKKLNIAINFPDGSYIHTENSVFCPTEGKLLMDFWYSAIDHLKSQVAQENANGSFQ